MLYPIISIPVLLFLLVFYQGEFTRLQLFASIQLNIAITLITFILCAEVVWRMRVATAIGLYVSSVRDSTLAFISGFGFLLTSYLLVAIVYFATVSGLWVLQSLNNLILRVLRLYSTFESTLLAFTISLLAVVIGMGIWYTFYHLTTNFFLRRTMRRLSG